MFSIGKCLFDTTDQRPATCPTWDLPQYNWLVCVCCLEAIGVLFPLPRLRSRWRGGEASGSVVAHCGGDFDFHLEE